ncbi:MAG: tRNA (N(6)-L-threonylcarbamoyladenosine(37)-C(2))-methylthiotransferase MtaB [Anaerolineae bacterium]|nr:tRNA (N(6)-L-threonylcarbamoyladenosine(37)-C(2))-methylthiotransferase MtaB [Anaerolineae bacterium]
MRVYLESLGCKLNQCERDALARQFADAGYTVVGDPVDADLCVVNTCAVTHVAARKSRRLLRHLQRLNPDAKLVATGCSVNLGEEALCADLAVRNEDKGNLVALVEDRIEGWGLSPAAADVLVDDDGLHARTRPMVKIQDGCDNACAYCIVHILRGKQRSRPRDEIVDEVGALVRAGYHEVVLTGVHVGSYGRDSGDTLGGLVRALLATPGPVRLRLSSIEPWDIEPGFFGLWADPRLCRHLHLPLQSGCDRTLRRMNRSYEAAEYAALVQQARAAIPDLALTTDVIAGFPGETEDEFAESAAFVERLAFARLHVFAYSPRPGTPAAEMPDQVDPQIARARAAELRAIGLRSGEAFRRQFLGRSLPVLWETRAPDGRWSGLTDNYIRVYAPCDADLANTVRSATMQRLEQGSLGASVP